MTDTRGYEMALQEQEDRKSALIIRISSLEIALKAEAERGDKMREAVEEIAGLDITPGLHNIKDPSRCALCIAKEALSAPGSGNKTEPVQHGTSIEMGKQGVIK